MNAFISIMIYKTPCRDFSFINGHQLATYGTISFRLHTKLKSKKKKEKEKDITMSFKMRNEFKVLLGNHYQKKDNTRSAQSTKTEMLS